MKRLAWRTECYDQLLYAHSCAFDAAGLAQREACDFVIAPGGGPPMTRARRPRPLRSIVFFRNNAKSGGGLKQELEAAAR